MRVKTIYTVILSIVILSCRGADTPSVLPARVLELAVRRPVGFPSLFRSNTGLIAVCADGDTASLTVTDIPFDRFGDSMPLTTGFSDKVADGPVPDFGAYAGVEIDGDLYLLYLDRKRETSPILKWLTRAKNGPWTADVVETDSAAWPLAVLEDEQGKAVPFWISGSSLSAGLGGSATVVAVQSMSPGSRASASLNGFSWYDPSAHVLVFFSVQGGVADRIGIGDAGPVHYAGRTQTGLPAVMTYSPAEKRLFLYEQAGHAGPMKKTTVALAEDVHTVYFAPFRGGYAFAYDEIGTGGYSLSILVPSGRRYEKYKVMEADSPISAFSAVIEGSILYILVLDEGLKLLEVRLPN